MAKKAVNDIVKSTTKKETENKSAKKGVKVKVETNNKALKKLKASVSLPETPIAVLTSKSNIKTPISVSKESKTPSGTPRSLSAEPKKTDGTPRSSSRTPKKKTGSPKNLLESLKKIVPETPALNSKNVESALKTPNSESNSKRNRKAPQIFTPDATPRRRGRPPKSPGNVITTPVTSAKKSAKSSESVAKTPVTSAKKQEKALKNSENALETPETSAKKRGKRSKNSGTDIEESVVKTSETSETSKISKTPKTPRLPRTPKTPAANHESKVEEVSKGSKTPKTPRTLKPQKTPKTVNNETGVVVEKAQETQKITEIQEPELSVSKTPIVVKTPKIIRKETEVVAEKTKETPKVMQLQKPEVSAQGSEIPKTPKTPTVSNKETEVVEKVKETPKVTEIPKPDIPTPKATTQEPVTPQSENILDSTRTIYSRSAKKNSRISPSMDSSPAVNSVNETPKRRVSQANILTSLETSSKKPKLTTTKKITSPVKESVQESQQNISDVPSENENVEDDFSNQNDYEDNFENDDNQQMDEDFQEEIEDPECRLSPILNNDDDENETIALPELPRIPRNNNNRTVALSQKDIHNEAVMMLNDLERKSRNLECLKSLNTDLHYGYLRMLKDDRSGNLAAEALDNLHRKFHTIFDPKHFKAMIKFDIDGRPVFEFVGRQGLPTFDGIENCFPFFENYDKATLMLSELIYDELYKFHLMTTRS